MSNRASPPQKRMKMRDLERATGVGREAIRFYIRKGLLPEPERPARNVAWYDDSFVERVSLIKRLQQERYLPLGVIKSIVGGNRRLSDDEMRTLVDLDGKLIPAADRAGRHRSEKLGRLAKRVGLRSTEIRELAEIGLVDIVTRRGEQWLDGNAIPIVEQWARLRRVGFSKDLGFGPPSLAIYVQFVQWLAQEELRLFASHVTGKIDRDTSQRMAEEGIECVNRMLGLLRETTLLRYIAEGNVAEPMSMSPRAPESRPRAASRTGSHG